MWTEGTPIDAGWPPDGLTLGVRSWDDGISGQLVGRIAGTEGMSTGCGAASELTGFRDRTLRR